MFALGDNTKRGGNPRLLLLRGGMMGLYVYQARRTVLSSEIQTAAGTSEKRHFPIFALRLTARPCTEG